MAYEGPERRHSSLFDLEIYRKIIETHSDVKNLVKTFESHVELDKKNQEDNLASLDSLKEFKWKSVGIIGIVLILMDVAIRYFLTRGN